MSIWGALVQWLNDLPFEVVPVVIGAILGALITRYLNRNREKVALAFEMHKEFNNLEMSAHRRKAVEVVKRFPNTPIFDLQDKDDKDAISVLIILRFDQRLGSSIKYRQIKKNLAIELFYEIFFYWYYVVFKPNLVAVYNWESAKQIEELAEWFRKNKKINDHTAMVGKMSLERKKVEKAHNALVDAKSVGQNNFWDRFLSVLKTLL